MSTSTFADGLVNDIKFSTRLLKRSPTYGVTCVLTLALGIGAATAVFSVIDATLLRPLPYRDPDRLVGLTVSQATGSNGAASQIGPSQIELVRWRSAGSFEAIEGLEPRMTALTGSGDPEVVPGAAIGSGLFPMLGVYPQTGRLFSSAEEHSDAPYAVVSDALTRRRFGNPSSAIGKSLSLDGRSYEIVGVMPPGFQPLLNQADVWVPLNAKVDPARANVRIMVVAARLRRAVATVRAQQELSAISAVLATEFPASHSQITPLVTGLRERLFGDRRPAFLTLGVAVLVLLVLSCVNVLNLTAGHLAVRRTELSLRAAIGGGAWRLARLQLVEMGMLALAAGLVGIALMNWLVQAFVILYEHRARVPLDARLDWRVAVFGAVLTLGTAILTGVIPALRAHRLSLAGGLVGASTFRVSGSLWERRIRAALVTAQVALAVTLLCGSGTFVTSMNRLLATNPGFDPAQVWSAQLRLPPLKYPDVPARARFVKQMLERVSSIPGVAAAGTTQTTFLPNEAMQTRIWIEGRTLDAAHTESVHIRHVTPGYFATLRLPLADGRMIDARDQFGAPLACVISARFARQFWPNESAIGHRIRRINANSAWMTIVGVAGDIMDNGLGIRPEATLYVAYFQQNTVTARVSLLVRAGTAANGFGRELEQAVWAIDPSQPVDGPTPLARVLAQSAGDQQFRTVLLTAFAVLGFALALVGIYGVTAEAITVRTREVGVRLALGATPSGVVFSMVSESARRLALGAAAGIALFLIFGRLASTLLYNTSLWEPGVLLASVAPLLIAALTVCYFQSRRLAEVQPASALRNEV